MVASRNYPCKLILSINRASYHGEKGEGKKDWAVITLSVLYVELVLQQERGGSNLGPKATKCW